MTENDQLWFSRLLLAFGCKNSQELASYLGITKKDVERARHSGQIPGFCLHILRRAKGVDPNWLLCGAGPMSGEIPEESVGKARYCLGMRPAQRQLEQLLQTIKACPCLCESIPGSNR